MARSDFQIIVAAVMLFFSAAGRTGWADDLAVTRPEDVGMSSAVLARVRPALQKFVDEGKVPGVVAIVARRGQTVLFEPVGWRDRDRELPMQRDTLFRIYSMTKPITSVAVMMLVEEGQLDLDAPVEKYLPELGEREVLVDRGPAREPARRKITTRDLLRHTSGLTYGFFGDTAVDKQYLALNMTSRDATLGEMVTKLQALPLVCHPGERFCYSVSTDVLARLVEVVADQPFDAFLQSRIFDPLGMSDTGFSVRDRDLDRFATNYGFDSAGKLRVVDAAETSPYRKPPRWLSGEAGWCHRPAITCDSAGCWRDGANLTGNGCCVRKPFR